MALVNCPECSNQVSEQAVSCPQCGHPLDAGLSASVPPPPAQPQQQQWGPPTSAPPPPAPPPPAAQGAWSPPAAQTTAFQDANVDPYYRDKFARIDQNGRNFLATWNWPAFIFGPFWYLVKGMWGKSLLYFAVVFFSAGFLALPLWIYGGVAGNYDYYLLKRQDKQFW